LAEIVRVDRAHHRAVAADSDRAEAIKLAARTHQTMIWERSRHVLRLRSALVEFFPAALEAFPDLDAPDALELLARAPDPDAAARLSVAKIEVALRAARRRDAHTKARRIEQILGAGELRQTPAVQATYAAVVAAQLKLIVALGEQVDQLGVVVEQHFGRHPDADIYASQPGLGVILGARVLGEFGDATDRYADGPQELRRHLTDHPRFRQETDRAGPLRPQPAHGRRPATVGVLLAPRLTRRTGLLRHHAREKHRPPSRTATTEQSSRRHSARLSENQNGLQRTDRLKPPQHSRSLTFQNLGCLPLCVNRRSARC